MENKKFSELKVEDMLHIYYKDFISKKYNGIQDMISNFSLEKIIESKDSFSVFFNALTSNTTNFLKDIKNMMNIIR